MLVKGREREIPRETKCVRACDGGRIQVIERERDRENGRERLRETKRNREKTTLAKRSKRDHQRERARVREE